MRRAGGIASAGMAAGLLAAAAYVSGYALAEGTPANAVDAERINALVKQLGDPAFAKREAAQKELSAMPVAAWEAFSTLAEKESDPEIKGRLEAVMGALDERAVLDLPAISVEVKDATAEELAAAMSKAMGVRIKPREYDLKRYTVKAEGKPFWEVMMEIGKEDSLSALDASVGRPWDLPSVVMVRGVAVSCGAVGLANGNARQRGVMVNDEVLVGLHASLDPRMQVLSSSPPVLDTAVDDQGRMLRLSVPPLVGGGGLGVGGLVRVPQRVRGPGQHVTGTASFILNPASAVVKTVNVKGHVEMVLAVAAERVVVGPDRINQGVRIGDQIVTVYEPVLDEKDNIYVGMRVVPIEKGAAGPQADLMESYGKLHLEVSDSTGKAVGEFWTHGMAEGDHYAVDNHFKGPLTYTVTVVSRVRRVVVPFEFKDVVVEK